MNIFSLNNLSIFSHSVYPAVKDRVLAALSDQKRRILLIASAMLAFFAACCVMRSYCFKAKMLNGYGKKNNPDGSVSEGMFQNDELHGHGKITFRNGTVLEGEFAHGKVEVEKGPVNFISTDGAIFEGDANLGKTTYPDGRVLEVRLKDGFGKMTYPDGRVLEGVSKDGKTEWKKSWS